MCVCGYTHREQAVWGAPSTRWGQSILIQIGVFSPLWIQVMKSTKVSFVMLMRQLLSPTYQWELVSGRASLVIRGLKTFSPTHQPRGERRWRLNQSPIATGESYSLSYVLRPPEKPQKGGVESFQTREHTEVLGGWGPRCSLPRVSLPLGSSWVASFNACHCWLTLSRENASSTRAGSVVWWSVCFSALFPVPRAVPTIP